VGKVIGLDIGTSAIKAITYEKGKIIDSKRIEFTKEESDGKTLEPEKVFKKVTEILAKLTKKNKDIKAIGLSTIFPSLLALDINRKPLTKIFTWMDETGAEIAKEFKQDKAKARYLHKKTGCILHESYPLWKIQWLKKNKIDIFLKSYKFISLSEYITLKLTGKFIISKPIASTTGLFDIHLKDWDDQTLDMIDISDNQLSECKPMSHSEKILDDVALKIGLEKGVKLVLGGGDGLLCNIGSGCTDDLTMSSTIGTSGALRIMSIKPAITNPLIWCYYLEDDRWVYGNAINAGYCSLEWFKKSIGQKYSYEELDKLASKTTVEGPIFFPFLDGERGPGYNQNMKASFIGMNSKDNPVTIYRSVVEGIMFNLYSCYEAITNDFIEPSKIHASGGYIGSDFMLQMQADIFNKEISVPAVKEASATGAAIIALKSIGEIQDISDVKTEIEKTFYPNKKRHEQYMERYNVYKTIYSIFF